MPTDHLVELLEFLWILRRYDIITNVGHELVPGQPQEAISYLLDVTILLAECKLVFAHGRARFRERLSIDSYRWSL